MKTIQIIIILSLFVFMCWSQWRFCFPLCSQCDGPAYSQCRGTICRSGTSFIRGTVTGSNFECTKAPYTYYSTGAKWEPTAVTTDVPAPTPYTMGTTVNITLSTLSLSTGATKTCSNGWTSYTYFSGLTGPDTLTINHPGVSGNVFYWQVRIIYGIITEDNWNTNTNITTTFDTNLTSLPSPNTPVQLGNAKSRVCNNNNRDEIYRVVIHTWTHTDPTPLDFSIITS